MKTEWKDYTNEQLLEMLANATETYYCCGGHTKAAHNDMRRKSYKEELEKRGVEIPDDKKLLEVGVFNGEGSW